MVKQKLKQHENRFSAPSSKMKKTEIEMVPEDWEELKLSESIEV